MIAILIPIEQRGQHHVPDRGRDQEGKHPALAEAVRKKIRGVGRYG